MYMSPNKKYTWYINQYKQQYCTSTYINVLTTDTADHEQVWQPYAVDPYYSGISKWWPYLLALYTNTDHQQKKYLSIVPINKAEYQVSVKTPKFHCFLLYGCISTQLQYPVVMWIL